MNSPIIIALDYPEKSQADALVAQLDPSLCRLKIGNALFTRYGPALVAAYQQQGFDIFLDLKFHDIPNTVAQAVRAACELGVWMVNVHAVGGQAMLEAAANVRQAYQSPPLLLAVTVLTSLQDADLAQLGWPTPTLQYVAQLAKLAQTCGLDGVVASAQEAQMLRVTLGDRWLIVTPGIHLQGTSTDQKRIMTPRQALRYGANYLVIGRAITQSEKPLATLQSLLDDLSG